MRIMMSADLLHAIDRELAMHPPERMLHVLGGTRPDGSLEATRWILDDEADASGMHVRASRSGQERIRQAEREHGVQYLGVVHSHPAGVPEPSGQDLRALADLLDLNPHAEAMLVGVVLAARTPRRGGHVARLPHGELAVHAGHRGAAAGPAVLRDFRPERDFFHGTAQRLPRGAVEAVRGARAVVVGCGSLGSVCAEALVRAGVPGMTLIDPDLVEAANLGRTVYTAAQIGRPKADALAQRLTAINPQLSVAVHRTAVEPATAAAVADAVRGADLVLGMADDQRALAVLDVLLHELDVPGVFAGVYRAAAGGDIVTVVPGLTACYRCTVAPRVRSTDLQPGTDYSTGRLQGEAALGADIALVAAAAARTALGVLGLVRGTDTWLEATVLQGRTYTQLGLAPGFFDQTALFAGVPGQHALQSIWIRPEGDSDCEHCAAAGLPTAQPAARRPGVGRRRRPARTGARGAGVPRAELRRARRRASCGRSKAGR